MQRQPGIKRELQPIILPAEHPSRRASRATVVFEPLSRPTIAFPRSPNLACRCGTVIGPEDTFCGQCGNPLKKPVRTVLLKEERKNCL